MKLKIYVSTSRLPGPGMFLRNEMENMKIKLEKAAFVLDRDVQRLKALIYRLSIKGEDVESQYREIVSKYHGNVNTVADHHSQYVPKPRGFQLNMPAAGLKDNGALNIRATRELVNLIR